MNDRRPQSHDRPRPTRWSKGYVFFKGNDLNTEWVDNLAKEFADLMSNFGLTGSQLRAFYNEFLRIRDITADPLEKTVLIKLLSAKINYRKTAKASDIPDDLVDFVHNLVGQIGDSQLRFKQACYIMEAFVGFFPKK